jgi:cytochrome c oxidase cbb3-type subunit 3
MKHPMRVTETSVLVLAMALCAVQLGTAQQRPGGGASAQSPAAKRPPASKSPQSYPAAQVREGESRFASQCGFCHGRDAQGGESGPDLTRSVLVAEDVPGDKLRPVILSGRPAAGMPGFALSPADLSSIVAFIHDAKSKAESVSGNRRRVDVEDLQTGNAEAGQRYFNGAGGCAACHSVSGSFANIGARLQGLALLQRMLYPRNRDPRAGNAPPVTVKTRDGQTVTGRWIYRDEFTITIADPGGWTHSFPVSEVTIAGEDPLRAHAEQLAKYSDEEMHDVFAYLQSLK